MTEEITHLVINWINIEDNVILVGATDNLRWKWDTEIGMSGVDAKTIVYVTLTDNGKGISVSEEAGFHCVPGDPVRNIAMSYLYELFEIAWKIKNDNLSIKLARKKFFGSIVKRRI
jgi:hypothetical protein